MENNENNNLELATFGAGCFWCVEAIFESLEGVTKVESGYSGGETINPTYKEVCEGTTGHAEVIQIEFNPHMISFEQLLNVFFEVHDPTTLNRQGNDIGTQYRSVIFYRNERQKQLAEIAKKAANESGVWENPIITEISPFDKLYIAEDYHQGYYNRVGDENSYCTFVITPKIEKFKKKFKGKLKEK